MGIDLKFNINNHLSRLSRDFNIPYKNNVIGWYRINEGEGDIVYNYSTASKRLPDLKLIGGISFWSIFPLCLGYFGISQPANRNYLKWRSDTPCVTLTGKNKPRCMFVYTTNYPPAFVGKDLGFLDILNNFEYSESGIEQNIGYYPGQASYAVIDQDNGSSYYTPKSGIENNWIFVFNVIDTYQRAKIVLSDGTLVNSNLFGGVFIGAPLPIKKVNIFGYPSGSYQYFDGSIADVIYWDDVYLTLEDFKTVYNSLRHRCNMKKPSGW